MKKDILALLSLALIIAVLIHGTNIQSVDEYYLTHIDDITPQSETVFISIRCDTVLQNYDELDKALQSDKYVPQNGVILPETEYVLRPGDTVFDILDRAVRYNKIQMEYQGADKNSYGSVYVQGINYLYEFSCGPLSGWMYSTPRRHYVFAYAREKKGYFKRYGLLSSAFSACGCYKSSVFT